MFQKNVVRMGIIVCSASALFASGLASANRGRDTQNVFRQDLLKSAVQNARSKMFRPGKVVQPALPASTKADVQKCNDEYYSMGSIADAASSEYNKCLDTDSALKKLESATGSEFKTLCGSKGFDECATAKQQEDINRCKPAFDAKMTSYEKQVVTKKAECVALAGSNKGKCEEMKKEMVEMSNKLIPEHNKALAAKELEIKNLSTSLDKAKLELETLKKKDLEFLAKQNAQYKENEKFCK